jgi:C-terminal processing protease CtpA/Prc
VVLDLRGTPPDSDFDAGADLAGFFCAKGTELFSLCVCKERADAAAQMHTFSTTAEPLFKGVLVVLVDGGAAEAPEAVAASLQKCAKALVVGGKTAGRAFQFSDVPLTGAVLRVAVAQVILTDGKEPGENGLTPDIPVALGVATRQSVMASITAKGVASVIEEHDRAHLTEAALVSGSNPEVDELEAEQTGHRPPEPLIDRQLQRALDLVTSISIYQAKAAGPAREPGEGE